jgi:hypothetical protein
MNASALANVTFLFLFVSYIVQFLFILARLRAEGVGKSLRVRLSELWIYMAMSLAIPILIGLLPDLLGRAIETWVRSTQYTTVLTSIQTPTGVTGAARDYIIGVQKVLEEYIKNNNSVPNFPLFLSVKCLIAYLITIVTLELALQAQALRRAKSNPWVGLLLTNLGFDIVSVVVFQIFQVVTDKIVTDTSVILFFFMCAIPTVATGIIVVSGSYAALTGEANASKS